MTCSRPDAGDKGGFTLLEMLVVVAILGLIAALGFPALDHAVAHQQFEADTHRLVLGIVDARSRALRTGTAVVVDRSEVMRVVGAPSSRPAPVRTFDIPQGGIGFFPDGSSTGGLVRLTESDHVADVRVEPDTGRIELVR